MTAPGRPPGTRRTSWARAAAEEADAVGFVIRLDDPSLVVLVGAAGAGKSTFAATHFAPGEILSSDALREAISGDAADQRATAPAFAALGRAVRRRLGNGWLTVVDATNVQVRARRPLLRAAAAAGIPAVAIVLDLPPTLVLVRNALRGRIVPQPAVLSQLEDLRRTLTPGRLDREGFAAVVRLADASTVARARVVRSPAKASPSRGR